MMSEAVHMRRRQCVITAVIYLAATSAAFQGDILELETDWEHTARHPRKGS
jgi:hypothetical protein